MLLLLLLLVGVLSPVNRSSSCGGVVVVSWCFEPCQPLGAPVVRKLITDINNKKLLHSLRQKEVHSNVVSKLVWIVSFHPVSGTDLFLTPILG